MFLKQLGHLKQRKVNFKITKERISSNQPSHTWPKNTHILQKGKYHCMAYFLFDW